jgi:hypothetical protein
VIKLKKLFNALVFQAKTIEFDVNFANFEDPDVLERFTGPDYVKYWKETYGFDYVAKSSDFFTTTINGQNRTVLDYSHLAKYCIKSEFR